MHVDCMCSEMIGWPKAADLGIWSILLFLSLSLQELEFEVRMGSSF